MFSAILLLFSVALSQDTCTWHEWTSDSWPNGETQFFQPVVSTAEQFLNRSDFDKHGQFAGEKWTDVFWRNPEYYRPLGFRYGVLEPHNGKMPCLRAHKAGGYKVELMIYTFQSGAKIAVKDLSEDSFYRQSNGAVEGSGERYFYHCFAADTDRNSTLEVAVYCEEGGECDQQIDLLWRFRRSSLRWSSPREFASDNPAMWCDMIAAKIVWPDQIQTGVPNDVQAGANSNQLMDGASALNAVTSLIFTTAFALFFLVA